MERTICEEGIGESIFSSSNFLGIQSPLRLQQEGQPNIGRYLHELTFCGSVTVNAIIIRNVRHYVRAKYDIPAAWFALGNTEEPNFDDFHLAVCSPNLATMQLLRHTADYRKYGCSMCSDRGLPRGAPGIV
jgi:hypothetical protein